MGWTNRVFGRRQTGGDSGRNAPTDRPERPSGPASTDKPRRNVRVRLIPPGSEAGTERSYLGGRPGLPAGMDWPCGPGGPCAFIGQIALDELPADLWDGLGPRQGHLLFFEDTAPTFAIRAIYCPGEGHLMDFQGPLWEHSSFSKNPPPRIFVQLEPYASSPTEDRVPDPHAAIDGPDDFSWLPVLAMDVFPDGRELPRYDFGKLLELPEYRPVDWASFQILASAMIEYARSLASTRTGPGRQDNEAWAEAGRLTRAKAEEFLGTLEEWGERIRQLEASGEAFADHAKMLFEDARQSAYSFYTVEPSGEVAPRETRIFSGRGRPMWLGRFAEQLSAYLLARAAAYPEEAAASDPSATSSWLATAARETGRMGVMQVPFADGDGLEPVNGDTRVLLLGLPPSKLLGWSWGGGYGLAIAIERADLRAGDFKNVIGRLIDY